MPDWVDLPLLSGAVQQRSDSAGNILTGSDIDAPSTVIEPRLAEWTRLGALNGAFARGPQSGVNVDIEDINALPDWPGPISASGGAITTQWVLDSTGTAYNVRLNMGSGAAADEVYHEQIDLIPSSTAYTVSAAAIVYCPTALMGSAGSADAKLVAQFMQSDGVTTVGSATTATVSLTTINAATGNLYSISALPNTDGIVPAGAAFVRIRFGLARSAAATTAAGGVEFTDVRLAYQDTKVTTYTTAGTYTWIPAAGSKAVRVLVWGGGGGGASGAEGTSAAVRHGGSAGGGGAFVERTLLIASLTLPCSGTVGAGGAGGVAPGGGTAGLSTTFADTWSRVVAYGGGAGYPPSVAPTADSGGGGGGSASVGQGGSTGANSMGGAPATVAGATGISSQGAGSDRAVPGHAAEYGGGAGGGHGSAAGAQRWGGNSLYGGGGGGAGGEGGISQAIGAEGGGTETTDWSDSVGGGGGAGGAVRTAGTAGSSGGGLRGGEGGGGGGGSTSTSVSAGNGGAGGAYGGGGGGGGGCVSGGASTAGDGGAGGDGAVIIVEW